MPDVYLTMMMWAAGLGGGSLLVAFLFFVGVTAWRQFNHTWLGSKEERTTGSLIGHFSAELQRLEGIIDRQNKRIDTQEQMLARLNAGHIMVTGLLVLSASMLRTLRPQCLPEQIEAVDDLCNRIDRVLNRE